MTISPTAVDQDTLRRVVRAVHDTAVPRAEAEYQLSTGGIEGVLAFLTAAVAEHVTSELVAATTTCPDLGEADVSYSAHGVTCRIAANPEEATTSDPYGVVTSCEVAGHPGVEVHAHSSTTVDGDVTVQVDAPEGVTIRVGINDATFVTTVGETHIYMDS